MRVCIQAQRAVYVLYRTKDKNIITVGTEGNVKSYDAQKRHTRPYVCVSVHTEKANGPYVCQCTQTEGPW